MGGILASPEGKYMKQTTFSRLRNHPGMAVHLGSGSADKDLKVRVQGTEVREFLQRRAKIRLGTDELLTRLEKICKESLAVIENIRSSKTYEKDRGLRQYIDIMLKETEDELRAYNESVLTTESKDQLIYSMGKEIDNICQEPLKISIHSSRADGLHPEDKAKTEPSIRTDKTIKVEELKKEIKRLEEENDRHACENDNLNIKMIKLEEEVKALNTRLSKLASDKLSENSPAIADLSDSNRPTKLGELYSELYDNEWTDAFEALGKHGRNDQEAIDILMKTLTNISEFCSKKAELFLKETDKTIKKLFESEGWDGKARNTMYNAKDKPMSSGEISMNDMQLYMKWEVPDARRQCSVGKDAKSLSESQNDRMTNKISSLRKEMGVCLLPLVKKTESKDQLIYSMGKEIDNICQEPLKISIHSSRADGLHPEDKAKTEPSIRTDKTIKVEELKKEIKRLEEENDRFACENDNLNIKMIKLEEEVKALNTRLSKLASDKLSENNPAIADLSDSNRPTKLGELYSELYDNEWTDAFEALGKHGRNDQEAIDILMKTLTNISEFCSKKAELFLKETDKTIKKLFESEGWDGKARNTMYNAKDKPMSSGEISMNDMQLYMKWEVPDARRQCSVGKDAKSLSESQNDRMTNKISSLRKEMGVCLLPLVKKVNFLSFFFAFFSFAGNADAIIDTNWYRFEGEFAF